MMPPCFLPNFFNKQVVQICTWYMFAQINTIHQKSLSLYQIPGHHVSYKQPNNELKFRVDLYKIVLKI